MSNGPGYIPNGVIRSLVALLALGAIIAFAFLFGKGMLDAWQAVPGTPPTYNDAFLYVATTVGALVGGIVAVGFGVPVPSGDGGNLLTRNLYGLTRLALPQVDTGAVIGSLYALIYIAYGAAAVVTWVSFQGATSALIKNLATTFIGLAVPMVAGYFRR